MKKLTAWLLALAVLVAASCGVAEGLKFSGQYEAVRAAREALAEKYGLEPAMYTLLDRSIEEEEDGSWVIAYAGRTVFAYVIGTYTVRVAAGKAEAAWSWDGHAPGSEWTDEVWGAEVLNKTVMHVARTNSIIEPYEAALKTAEAHGGPDGGQASEAEAQDPQAPWLENALQAVALESGLSEETVSGAYSLENCFTDGRIVYYHFWLWQDSEEWLPGNGSYDVCISLNDGTIMDAVYDASLSGNG